MNLIQPFLLLCVLVGALVGFVRFRSASLERILVFLFTVMACIFVVYPGATTWIAHWLGVGRGTDLLLYVITIMFFFFFLLTYSRFLHMERVLTRIIRELALSNALAPTADGKPTCGGDATAGEKGRD
jgi:hypothetical protein